MLTTLNPLKTEFEPVEHQPANVLCYASGSGQGGVSVAVILESNGVSVTKCSHTPRLAALEASSPKNAPGAIALILARSNKIRCGPEGQEVLLNAGEAVFLQDFNPGTLNSAQSFRYVAVVLEKKRCEVHHCPLSRLQKSSEALKLLKAYVQCLERSPPVTGEVREVAAKHVCELFVQVVCNEMRLEEASSPTLCEARLQLALCFIAKHFSDPALSAAAVAADQGISTRYLQKLFERASLSFTTHVNELRLQRAVQELNNPKCSNRRISDIAYAVGFSDLSYFNRLFRRRFGMSPRMLR